MIVTADNHVSNVYSKMRVISVIGKTNYEVLGYHSEVLTELLLENVSVSDKSQLLGFFLTKF